jgi:hypothetical protein
MNLPCGAYFNKKPPALTGGFFGLRSESNKLSKMGDYFVARKASSESSIAFIHGVW